MERKHKDFFAINWV